MFYMESHIESEGKKDAENNLIESLLEKKDALTMSFGSKRKQKAIESRMKYAVQVEELDVVMNKTAKDVDVAKLEMGNGIDLTGFLTINWEAKRLNEVYDLDEIITEWELQFLGDSASELAEVDPSCIDTWRPGATYQPFILDRLVKFQATKATELIRLLLYLHYLIQFSELKAADVRKPNPLPDEIPYKIRQKIIESYTTSSVNSKNSVSKATTPELKDKLVAHIMALGLRLNDFKIDMQQIKCIKFSRERLGLIGRMIGARLTGTKVTKILELKLPLTKFTGIVKRKVLCISLFSVCVNGNCSILEEMFIFERLMKPCGEEQYQDDFDTEKRLTEMLQLSNGIMSEVKNLHVLMNSPKCDGLTLDTLPPLPNVADEKAGDLIYSALMYQAAHVFSIASEHDVFPLICSNNSEHLAYGFRKLGGKLLLLQCFINDEELPPMLDEKQKTRFRFRDECSARQTRDCVVLKRTLDVLNLLLPTILSSDVIKRIAFNATH
uniref:Uncharacterized protein n=1 Tax=Strigamia maritima TaxID=126957 RepID=T1J414_STRMM